MHDAFNLQNESDLKHVHYLSSYTRDDIMWGLGIENETYLQQKDTELEMSTLVKKPERYSVNYFKNYPDGLLDDLLPKKGTIPVLINAHTFLKTDVHGQHVTIYSKNKTPNPKFSGKTIFELLKELDPFFSNEEGKQFIFDGDTIEFATTRFYKTNIQNVIDELINMKKTFLEKIQPILKNVCFADKNYGLATFLTNKGHLTLFNNMTYHFNITLPTELDNEAKIKDPIAFITRHRILARLLQWISPLLIAKYGSGDCLVDINENTNVILTKASQRVALSRYIGLGTYDTEKMPIGKLLNIKYTDHIYYDIPFWWYHEYRKKAQYIFPDMIGYDINFNKHPCHGIEFRLMDYFPESDLYSFLILIVKLADYSLEINNISNPILFKSWNDMVLNIVINGKDANITDDSLQLLQQIFNVNLKTLNKPLDVLNIIEKKLLLLQGDCSLKFV